MPTINNIFVKNDLRGQIFGEWEPLYPVRFGGKNYWHCRCSCGTEKDVYTSNLTSGKSKSCGCKHAYYVSQATTKDIVGQKFNMLTVLEKTDKRANGAIVWKCQCDCGNIVYIPTGNLKSGHTKSCGCKSPERLKLEGQKFGRLTVIERVGTNNHHESIWRCKCDCGNETIAVGYMLRNGSKQSCGCLVSKGEAKIQKLLNKNKISYEYQKIFSDCIYPETKHHPVFDFFVEGRYLIEFDGEQHFMEQGTGYYTPERLKRIKETDKFKNEWCKEKGIPLIRIKYTQLKDLTFEDIYKKEI